MSKRFSEADGLDVDGIPLYGQSLCGAVRFDATLAPFATLSPREESVALLHEPVKRLPA